jgi:hypothetical protein
LGLDYCCLQVSRYFGLEVKHHFKAIYIIWFMCVWTTIIFIGTKMVARDKGYIICKDDGSNFNTLFVTLSLVVTCASLHLVKPFARWCFGHVISKVC